MTSDQASSPETCALVLQGGGALGSYQAGVLEAMTEAGQSPDWVAGVSIGAINAALIAGNPPGRRIERMRAFWSRVTSGIPFQAWWPSDEARAAFSSWSAAWGTLVGAPGFFSPRIPPRALYPSDAPGPISYYDTAPLRETLLELVDFDLINQKRVRLSVGAVDVATGNLKVFDNVADGPIGPEHVMASGALPPGFSPVKVGDAFYWDGGLVSNTPLQFVLDEATADEIAVVQVDLFPARGPLPETLAATVEREKDIRYSSRTRLNTEDQLELQRTKSAFRRLARKLPPELADDPDVKYLAERARESAVSILQLIYRRKAYESGSKDYEFSRATMLDHWTAGLDDARLALADPGWIGRRQRRGVWFHDPLGGQPARQTLRRRAAT
ncbi:patatin-like phospholipase family protein [Chelatococcus sambhunathii]|uniref:Patatin-like phospholipase family protein n=1 Tax=Chelatococcus sambhunathii TaxID=363953 RepID=A0ABU1DJ92_9HYPH|nr:patatin-like phospholipase family protein [Chelatococcus sambhunathii]MDR4308080.1 patatin-like phospholipase family protein [Chelatococcus sambhunathii]